MENEKIIWLYFLNNEERNCILRFPGEKCSGRSGPIYRGEDGLLRLPGAGNGSDVYKFSTGLCKMSTIQKGKTAKYYIIAQRMDVKLVRYSIWLSGTK